MKLTISKSEFSEIDFENEIYFTTGYDNEDSRTDYYIKFTERFEYEVFITDHFDNTYTVSMFKKESNHFLSNNFKWKETTKQVFDKKWNLALSVLKNY